MSRQGPIKHILGQNGRFWANHPNYFGSKSSATHLSENLVRIVFFSRAWHQMDQNGQYFSLKWQKMHILGQIWPFLGQKSIFWGDEAQLLVCSYQETNETHFLCWKHWLVQLKLAFRYENVQFWPKNLDIWGQKSNFCYGIAIFDIYFWKGYFFLFTTFYGIGQSMVSTACL